MTPTERLALIPRIVSLLRWELDHNGQVYDGRMTPNLQSISDLCTVGDEFLSYAEAGVARLEHERGL